MSAGTITSEITDPYAQALMALAEDRDLTDRFGQDADALLELFEASGELQQFLANPTVSEGNKKQVLQQVAGETLHPLFTNFLKLLVDKKRVLFLANILRQYKTLLRQRNRTVLAEVTAAVELTDEQQATLRQKVLEMTGARDVELSISVDSDLLGGVIIQVGSQVVDASLRGQLRRLSLQLSTTA